MLGFLEAGAERTNVDGGDRHAGGRNGWRGRDYCGGDGGFDGEGGGGGQRSNNLVNVSPYSDTSWCVLYFRDYVCDYSGFFGNCSQNTTRTIKTTLKVLLTSRRECQSYRDMESLLSNIMNDKEHH